ncbi:hypothetical protein NE237_016373 [Protea cynaroides]|uniref:Uncharacterized protein n=1 Tax=Protea cynaroides TaxID=273540 RepID=A0A9Q0JRB2_9MAGN|nr:hypothetical protein NE237_016373 [Protea cynaroides]
MEVTVGQLRDHFRDASFMVFNFREGEKQSQIASILSEYDMPVMDFPRLYEGYLGFSFLFFGSLKPPIPGSGVIGSGRWYGRGVDLEGSPNALVLWDREVFLQPVDVGSRSAQQPVATTLGSSLQQSSIAQSQEARLVPPSMRFNAGPNGSGGTRTDRRVRYVKGFGSGSTTDGIRSVFPTSGGVQSGDLLLGGMHPLSLAGNLQEGIRVSLSHVNQSSGCKVQ